jgi:hypothetical protein
MSELIFVHSHCVSNTGSLHFTSSSLICCCIFFSLVNFLGSISIFFGFCFWYLTVLELARLCGKPFAVNLKSFNSNHQALFFGTNHIILAFGLLPYKEPLVQIIQSCSLSLSTVYTVIHVLA